LWAAVEIPRFAVQLLLHCYGIRTKKCPVTEMIYSIPRMAIRVKKIHMANGKGKNFVGSKLFSET
jgi:hypothetical protein